MQKERLEEAVQLGPLRQAPLSFEIIAVEQSFSSLPESHKTELLSQDLELRPLRSLAFQERRA
jgi:hypothetical protein